MKHSSKVAGKIKVHLLYLSQQELQFQGQITPLLKEYCDTQGDYCKLTEQLQLFSDTLDELSQCVSSCLSSQKNSSSAVNTSIANYFRYTGLLFKTSQHTQLKISRSADNSRRLLAQLQELFLQLSSVRRESQRLGRLSSGLSQAVDNRRRDYELESLFPFSQKSQSIGV